MSDTLDDYSKRENERRVAIRLPPLPKRGRKPLSEYTEEDILEYIKEVKSASRSLYSTEDEQNQYVGMILKDVEKQLSVVEKKKKRAPKQKSKKTEAQQKGKVKTSDIEKQIEALRISTRARYKSAADLEKDLAIVRADLEAEQKEKPKKKKKAETTDSALVMNEEGELSRVPVAEEKPAEEKPIDLRDLAKSKQDQELKSASPVVAKILDFIDKQEREKKGQFAKERLRQVKEFEQVQSLAASIATLTESSELTNKLLQELLREVQDLSERSRDGQRTNGNQPSLRDLWNTGLIAGGVLGGAAVGLSALFSGGSGEVQTSTPQATPVPTTQAPEAPTLSFPIPQPTPVPTTPVPTTQAPEAPTLSFPIPQPTPVPTTPQATPVPTTQAPEAPTLSFPIPQLTPVPTTPEQAAPPESVSASEPTAMPGLMQQYDQFLQRFATPETTTQPHTAPITQTPPQISNESTAVPAQTSTSDLSLPAPDTTAVARSNILSENTVLASSNLVSDVDGATKVESQAATKTTADVTAEKTDEQIVNEEVNRQDALAREYETNPMLFSNRELFLRARKLTFSGDEIEFKVPSGERAAAPPPAASGGGSEGGGTGGGGIPGSSGTQDGGGGAAPSGDSHATPVGPGEQAGGSSVTNLTFAPGVDNRIQSDIAEKVKQIESAFGQRLTVTSGYRDQQRNQRVGGARNSAHTRGNAVDIQFRGNEQDTIKLIQAASAAGIGGIGVYRPGWVHLDTESKRVWGPDFTAGSIPEWAKESLQAHMSGRRTQRTDAQRVESTPESGGNIGGESAAPASTPDSGGSGGAEATPQERTAPTSGSELMSGGEPPSSGGEAATPVSSAPPSGAEVAAASQENAVAERTPASPTVVSAGGDQPPDPGNPSVGSPVYGHSVGDPGNVEPEDAGVRYSRLFGMVA